METRGRRMVNMLKDRKNLEVLKKTTIPKNESTKGTTTRQHQRENKANIGINLTSISNTTPANVPDPQGTTVSVQDDNKKIHFKEEVSASTRSSPSISLKKNMCPADTVEENRFRTRRLVNYGNIHEEEELLDYSTDESEYDPKKNEGSSSEEENSTGDENSSRDGHSRADVNLNGYENDCSFEKDKQNQCDKPYPLYVAESSTPRLRTPNLETNELQSPPSPLALKIDIAKKNDGGKRKWDRKYYCKFCTKSYPKLPRHLENKHAKELEVASFLALPKGSKDRKTLIDKLRTEGERVNNFKIYSSRKNCGIVVPKRRPTKDQDVRSFLPCEYCGMLMSKTYLSRHARKCAYRPTSSNGDTDKSSPISNRLRARCAMLLPSAPDVPDVFKSNILNNMSYDEVYNVIICDELILAFGVKLFETKMRRPSQYREVKDRMRELARLLMSVKTINSNVNTLADIIDVTKYTAIVKAAKHVAGFDPETGKYETPSLVIKLGQSLMKCAARYKGLCMDDEILHAKLPKIELFQERMRENWTDDATKDAHATLQERKWNAPQRLPMSEDVRKLNQFLILQDNTLLDEFKKSKSLHIFRKLCENTLCRLILLNRRRVGEAQYIRLSDYIKSKLNTNINESEVMKSLSDTERILVKSLQRIEIRGKRGRMVPVILTTSLQETIEVLIEARNVVGVPKENDFLFPALHSCTGHYRADALLRNAAHNSGASNPDTLTGTQLRKHVATMMQLLNLRENELDAVANYLGHDIRVHRQYYRLPHDAMQLAKVSKVLLNMENGNVSNMRGMNLDQIQVDDTITDREENVVEDADDDYTYTSEPIPLVAHVPEQTTKAQTRAPCKRERFSIQDSQKIKTYFSRFIEVQRVPTLQDVKQFFIIHPEMNQVKWSRIKMCVYNCFAYKKRMFKAECK